MSESKSESKLENHNDYKLESKHISSSSSSSSSSSIGKGLSKSLSVFGSTTSYHAPDIFIDPNQITKRHLQEDALLRIMREDAQKNSDRLIMLAEKGDIRGIEEMLDSGINLSVIEGLHGYSPLHHACNRNQSAVVSLLIKAGVDLSQRNHAGDTALHFAAYAGNLLVCEQLIDCGISIDAINKDGESALFYAARRADPALVRLLLQRGANMEIEDRFGDTAIDQAEDLRTKKTFESHAEALAGKSPKSPASDDLDNDIQLSPAMRLPYTELLHIFRYLTAKEVCRAAMVAGKWHRVSECQEIWLALGVRRWELALQKSIELSMGMGIEIPVGGFGRLAGKKKRKEGAKVLELTQKMENQHI